MLLTKKNIFVPEIIQTSNMDCGPACLKSLAQGFGVRLSYDGIRTVCQTDVDGTSIDDLQDLLISLDFDVKQHISPLDHILLNPKEHFPAIGFIKNPNDSLHFNVFWGAFGRYIQMMDPAHGRYYFPKQALANKLYQHRMLVDAKEWYAYATTAEFLQPLQLRTEKLSGQRKIARDSVNAILALNRIYPLMAFDASVRYIEHLHSIRCIEGLAESRLLLSGFWQRIIDGDFKLQKAIPKNFWYAYPKEYSETFDEIYIQGPVFVSVKGKKSDKNHFVTSKKNEKIDIKEIPTHPVRDLLTTIRRDSATVLAFLIVGIVTGSLIMFVETLLFRSLMNLTDLFSNPAERLKLVAGLAALSVLGVLIEFPLNSILFRSSRKFDIGFRLEFFDKFKKIRDDYFTNRLSSDLLHRIHNIYRLRELPIYVRDIIDLLCNVGLLVGGLIYLFPAGAAEILIFTALQLFVPLVFLKMLSERDLSVQTILGSLQRFNLDALQGTDALRSHGAEKALKFEFDQMLAKWKSMQLRNINTNVLCNTLLSILATFGLCFLTYRFLESGKMLSEAFLFAFWALSLTYISQPLMAIVTHFSSYKNILTRLGEPLKAKEEQEDSFAPNRNHASFLFSDPASTAAPDFSNGIEIEFKQVSVIKAKRQLLSDINIKINKGEHIAIVGKSGAGKSTFLSTILGWTRPTDGQVLFNSEQLQYHHLKTLYESTAWVDPDVMLWNKSLLENVRYGLRSQISQQKTDSILNTSFMLPIIEALPMGSLSKLGEQGAFVSGGEGQRIRFARALNQSQVKLVVMDEPFRGLEGDTRQRLLEHSRKEWKDATLVCVLHDIRLALSFDRILVIENGIVKEFDKPNNLMVKNSRVKQLFDEEQNVYNKFWTNDTWKHLQLKSRGIVELDKSNLGYNFNHKEFEK